MGKVEKGQNCSISWSKLLNYKKKKGEKLSETAGERNKNIPALYPERQKSHSAKATVQ